MSFYGTCYGCMQRWELGTKSTCLCDEPGMKYDTHLGIHTIPQPNGTIQFLSPLSGDTVEVMRLSRDGVWTNPDLKPNEVAQAVLNALDANIKLLVQRAVLAEREACAKMAEAFHRHGYDFTGDAELHEAIRSRT